MPLAIGLAVAVHAGWWVYRSVPVRATVVDIQTRRDATNATPKKRYLPVVEYLDASGSVHRLTGRVSWNKVSSSGSESVWRRGDTVQVRYDPRNPAHAKMAGVWTWFLPGVFVSLAALMLLTSFQVPD